MHVKICGLTNLADARTALRAGADLLGFNFYRPSPRYIEPAAAAQIIATLRAESGGTRPQAASTPVRRAGSPLPGGYAYRCVGVLVNMPLAEALALRELCGLDLLQLHGDETVEYCQALAPFAFKALRPRSAAEAEDGIARFGAQASANAPRFLIDASHPQLYGGTGATGDWSLGRSIAERFPILLAGGLTPDNVREAIRAVRPWGIDVASGVERSPGVKDAGKVQAFVQAAHATTVIW
jgi:phosphoribosylanthranilate isomerase